MHPTSVLENAKKTKQGDATGVLPTVRVSPVDHGMLQTWAQVAALPAVVPETLTHGCSTRVRSTKGTLLQAFGGCAAQRLTRQGH